MSKYIDAEKLIAEIKRWKELITKIECEANKKYCIGYADAIKDILHTISSHQQEQPEVDLDAEIAIYLNKNVLNRINYYDIIEDFTTMEAGELASHFYELGLNARKEE